MNDELLAEARRAQERLIDAERDADVARAEFYRAVRRLHLHGASLRELAASLGLSHQRMHQIVEEAGGSRRWVRIGGTRRNQNRDLLACTFCGKLQNEVRKLIAGPRVYICDRCIALTGNVISSGNAAGTALGSISAVPDQVIRIRCSFCGKDRGQTAGLAAMPSRAGRKASEFAAICSECLELCNEIITEEDNLSG